VQLLSIAKDGEEVKKHSLSAATLADDIYG
jgi:hypothetical protein